MSLTYFPSVNAGADSRRATMRAIIEENVIENREAFFLVDLGAVQRQHANFTKLLPTVQPFYAVKCSPDPVILRALAAMNVRFDCASRAEIEAVLSMGVPAEHIIYANPCKPVSHLAFAREQGVAKMTFDNEDELHKIAEHYPEAEVVLRILTDDSGSVCKFGIKFGASLEVAQRLVTVAKQLKLNLVGVSFHVGSGCTDAYAYMDAISRARAVFDMAEAEGMKLSLLDIGGGFPGVDDPEKNKVLFSDIAEVVKKALDVYFPPEMNVFVMAEPGRYYAQNAMSLAVNVMARRVTVVNESVSYMYYVNDGVYGSFNCTLFDHYACDHGVPLHDAEAESDEVLHASSIWGPTCDSMDLIAREVYLRRLEVGDWLFYDRMGAYTCAASSSFNGFHPPRKIYTFSLGEEETFAADSIPHGFPLKKRISQSNLSSELVAVS